MSTPYVPYTNSIHLLKSVRQKVQSFSDVQPHLYAAPRLSGAASLLKFRLQWEPQLYIFNIFFPISCDALLIRTNKGHVE